MQVNQRLVPPIDKTFVSLGQLLFEANRDASVSVTNLGADGHVIIDAVQLILVPGG